MWQQGKAEGHDLHLKVRRQLSHQGAGYLLLREAQGVVEGPVGGVLGAQLQGIACHYRNLLSYKAPPETAGLSGIGRGIVACPYSGWALLLTSAFIIMRNASFH